MKRNQRLFEELKILIYWEDWAGFDNKLSVSDLPSELRKELLHLKSQVMEASQREQKERQHQAVMNQLLKSSLNEGRWDDFDNELAKSVLPLPLREELLDLKAQAMDAQKREEEELRRHNAINELKSLLTDRQWLAFDKKLALSKLLESEREQLLCQKSNAIADLIDKAGDIHLDANQSRIIASPAKVIRITARAGSGKTRLLTSLAYFLVEECKVQPENILILAFNKEAANEIEDRLTNLLKVPNFPGARTFHSLAYRIVSPQESLIYDKGKEIADRPLTSLVQNILGDLLDDNLLDDIYNLFRYETSEARNTGAFLTGEAAYDFRRELTQFTLQGHAVKSRGEKYIGDFLFEHGITHYYEESFRWEDSYYRPDFKIMVGGKKYVIWEHWAVDPDAECVSPSEEWPKEKLLEYQKSAFRKRKYWEDYKKIPLIESCADACGDREKFEAIIADKLRPHFPNLQRLPKEQLLENLVKIHLSRLAEWLGQAIQRAQKRGWDAAKLTQELMDYSAEPGREKLFLALLEKVFTAYETRLLAEKKTDFDRLFNQAITILKANQQQVKITDKQSSIDLRRLLYCLVDESQDLSLQFIEVVSCLRKLNPHLKLMFVGDDWQAINRFAGSDVQLFTDEIITRFGTCATPTLATNYRSVSKVVLAGNKLMRGQGNEAKPHKKEAGTIQLTYLDQIWIEYCKEKQAWTADEPFRECGNGLDAFFKALYQLAIRDLKADKTIGVLFRTNQRGGKKLPELKNIFVRLLRRMGWPKEQVDSWRKDKIRFSTAHQFKGKERDTVFVVDPYAGYFPLLNAASIELFRFFGDSLEQAEADERRLFYVAITRAQERLVFLTEQRLDNKEGSPYLAAFRDLIEVIQIPNEPILPRSLNATK